MSQPTPYDDLTAPALSPDFSRALDAVADSGFASWGAADDAATRRVRRLLARLDDPSPEGPALLQAGGSSLLVDVTMARVLKQGSDALAGRIDAPRPAAALSSNAADELDRFVASHWQPGERNRAAVALDALLSEGLPESTSNERRERVERTFDLVMTAAAHQSSRFRMPPVEDRPARTRPSFRWSDLISVAAMILIGASVGWPMLTGVRHQTMETACASNLSAAARGFSMYAQDYDGIMPQAQASFLGGPWWNVGQKRQSHSANLYRLVQGGYTSLGDLACPGNRAAAVFRTSPGAQDWRAPEEVSYSYQLFGPGRPQWNRGSTIVALVDKSPIVPRARRGERFDPMAPSLNHGGRGQHVLFSDGSVRLLASPVLDNGDNLWLPTSSPASLTGREMPMSDRDAFVGP